MKGTNFETEGFEEYKKDDESSISNIWTSSPRKTTVFQKGVFSVWKPPVLDPLGPGDSYNYSCIEGWPLAELKFKKHPGHSLTWPNQDTREPKAALARVDQSEAAVSVFQVTRNHVWAIKIYPYKESVRDVGRIVETHMFWGPFSGGCHEWRVSCLYRSGFLGYHVFGM